MAHASSGWRVRGVGNAAAECAIAGLLEEISGGHVGSATGVGPSATEYAYMTTATAAYRADHDHFDVRIVCRATSRAASRTCTPLHGYATASSPGSTTRPHCQAGISVGSRRTSPSGRASAHSAISAVTRNIIAAMNG